MSEKNGMKDLTVHFCGVTFKNPVIAASTDISRTEIHFEELIKSGVGGIVTKSVTDAVELQSASIARFDIRDMDQNKVKGSIPDQYTFFSRGGSMVSMDKFATYAKDQLELANKNNVVLIGSISASKVENWVKYALIMEQMGFPMLELNFGNPHGEASNGKLGFLIGQSPELCCEIVSKILEQIKIPVVVKLTPQIADIVDLVKNLKEIGVKAVTVMHRFQGLIVDIEEDSVALGGWAAIGGTWMKPISLANISKVYRQVDIEICGGNGADTGKDVMEYILCGASIVQIGSSLMLKGAEHVETVLQELKNWMDKKQISSLEEAKGTLAKKIVTYKNLGDLPLAKSVLDLKKCETCEEKQCSKRCYFGALIIENGKIFKDETKCTGCSMCQHICDKNAIVMREV